MRGRGPEAVVAGTWRQRIGFGRRGGNRFAVLGLGVENGFVRDFCIFAAKGLQTLEVLDGAAVEALVLSLVAEEKSPGWGTRRHVVKAFGQGQVLSLARGHLGVVESGEIVAGVEEAGAEETAFEAGGAQDVLLGDGDALDGVKLLAVDGLVEAGAQLREVVRALEDRGGRGAGGEAVFAGVLGGDGLAARGTGAGGTLGVGAIGGQLPG